MGYTEERAEKEHKKCIWVRLADKHGHVNKWGRNSQIDARKQIPIYQTRQAADLPPDQESWLASLNT